MCRTSRSRNRLLKSDSGVASTCDAYVARTEEEAIHGIARERAKLKHKQQREKEVERKVRVTLPKVKWLASKA